MNAKQGSRLLISGYVAELKCTVRACLDCGALVAGGPTRCGRCAKDAPGDTPESGHCDAPGCDGLLALARTFAADGTVAATAIWCPKCGKRFAVPARDAWPCCWCNHAWAPGDAWPCGGCGAPACRPAIPSPTTRRRPS
jgi:hypothetical protein